MMTLSARLQLELRNRDPSEVTELILDNSKANEIEGLDDSYSNLRELSLVNVGLTSLKGFPNLPNLEKLDLSDNKISSGLDILSKCENLSQLLLTNNRIKNIKDLECLSSLKHLEVLDLFNCSISYMENYRREIFSVLPSLKYLDGFDEKNEEELNESEDEYEEDDENVLDDQKEVYEVSDNTGSEEEEEDDDYESDEGDEIIENTEEESLPRVASKTGGKDMNLFHQDNVEISDEDEDVDDEEDDEDEEDEEDDDVQIIQDPDFDQSNNDEISNLEDPCAGEEIVESTQIIPGMNGTIPTRTISKEVDRYLSDSDDEDDEGDENLDEEVEEEEEKSNKIICNNDSGRNRNLKRKYDDIEDLQNCLDDNLDEDSRGDVLESLINDASNVNDDEDNNNVDEDDDGEPNEKMMKHNCSTDSIEHLLDDPTLLDPTM